MCAGDTCLIAMVELCCNYLSSKDHVASRDMTVGEGFCISEQKTLCHGTKWVLALDSVALHGPESVFSIVTPTVWLAQGSNCSGARFSTHTQIGSEAHPAPSTVGIEALCMGKATVVCP